MKRNVQVGDLITFSNMRSDRALMVVQLEGVQPAVNLTSPFIAVNINVGTDGASVPPKANPTRWTNVELDTLILIGTAKFKTEVKYTITKTSNI